MSHDLGSTISYRIRRVPVHCTETSLQASLAEAYGIKISSVRVASLSVDQHLERGSNAASLTATVVFNAPPQAFTLKSPPWRQNLLMTGSDNMSSTTAATVTIDTFFDGFTPLSPVSKRSMQTIE